jgi:diaminopimelate epimerase
MNLMLIRFSKYHGAGNDFIIIDNRNHQFPADNYSLIEKLCRRRFGIGADGLILIEDDHETAYIMRYYNADGQPGSFCGNGSRCAVLYAYNLGIIQPGAFSFKSSDGIHQANYNLNNDLIEVSINVNAKPVAMLDGWFVDTGSPHYIMFRSNLQNIDITKEGSFWRLHDAFQPGGANVNFVQVDNDKLLIRTFERGVEAETYACGTGVVAAALTAIEANLINSTVVVIIAKGGELSVILKDNDIYLSGPALKVYDGSTIL